MLLPESTLKTLLVEAGVATDRVHRHINELWWGGFTPRIRRFELDHLIRKIIDAEVALGELLLEAERLRDKAAELDQADDELLNRRLREAEASGAVVRIDQRRAA